jgi:hypothetical protein
MQKYRDLTTAPLGQNEPRNLRRYAPHPLAADPREEPRYEPRSDERFFLDEQCPSESYFGR